MMSEHWQTLFCILIHQTVFQEKGCSMTSKKLKKTFTAAFLSGSILLQNFPALAAASDTTDWLKESPFRQDITTEKSTPTESVPSETETVSP